MKYPFSLKILYKYTPPKVTLSGGGGGGAGTGSKIAVNKIV
jgi:hypothetical protein